MIGPKAWDRIVTKLLSQGAAVAALGAVWLLNSRIFALNSMLVCMRPGIAMEIGFKNWNRCRMSGLPVDSPLPLFWGLNWGVL